MECALGILVLIVLAIALWLVSRNDD
jgi:hypothetical protein